MNSTRLMRAAVLATTMGTVLVGCGGGGGSGSDPDAFKTPLEGGIWHGTDSISGQSVYGIVNESGAFVFLRADNVLYSGTATFDKGKVTGTFEGFTPPGFAFGDTSVHGTGGVSGVLVAQQSLDLAVTFATDKSNGAAENGVLNLTYDKLYERAASLFTIAGTFGTNGQAALSIATNGTVFAQYTNGCVVNGTVTVDNEQHNSYTMSLTYASCAGASASLNGTYKGMVTLDNSKSPERLIGGVSVSGSSPVAIPITLDRM